MAEVIRESIVFCSMCMMSLKSSLLLSYLLMSFLLFYGTSLSQHRIRTMIISKSKNSGNKEIYTQLLKRKKTLHAIALIKQT